MAVWFPEIFGLTNNPILDTRGMFSWFSVHDGIQFYRPGMQIYNLKKNGNSFHGRPKSSWGKFKSKTIVAVPSTIRKKALFKQLLIISHGTDPGHVHSQSKF